MVFGDNRDGDKVFMDLVGKVNQEKDIAFAVNTGDLVAWGQRSGYENYLNMTSKLKVPLYNVIGNHDAVRGGYRIFRELFGETYYSFNFGNSHFVILDNSLPGSFNQKQFRWFKADLEATRQQNIFVFLPRPAFDPK